MEEGLIVSDIITLACITQNRIDNVKRLLKKTIDYVDKVVLVDGFSIDGTKEWAESFSDKVIVTQRKWNDSFADQYNEYLKHVNDGWILILDDDEVPSEDMLNSLRSIISESEDGNKYGIVAFKCNPIEVDNEGTILADNGPVDYYRQLLIKYSSGLKYIIDLHQALVGHKNNNLVRRSETYYHIKSDEDMYRNSSRNWWIDGVWLSGASAGFHPQEWFDLRAVVKEAYPDVEVFSDLNAKMVAGNLDQRVKDYLIKVKDIKDVEPQHLYNELRGYFKYYFEKLHPEEHPDKTGV